MLGSRVLQSGRAGGASNVAQHPRWNNLGSAATEQCLRSCTEMHAQAIRYNIQATCAERDGCTAKPNPSRYTRHLSCSYVAHQRKQAAGPPFWLCGNAGQQSPSIQTFLLTRFERGCPKHSKHAAATRLNIYGTRRKIAHWPKD